MSHFAGSCHISARYGGVQPLSQCKLPVFGNLVPAFLVKASRRLRGLWCCHHHQNRPTVTDRGNLLVWKVAALLPDYTRRRYIFWSVVGAVTPEWWIVGSSCHSSCRGTRPLKWDAMRNYILNRGAEIWLEQLRYLLSTVLTFQNAVLIPAVVISSIGICSFWGRLLCRPPNALLRFNSATCCGVQEGCVCVCVCVCVWCVCVCGMRVWSARVHAWCVCLRAWTNTYQPSEVTNLSQLYTKICSYRTVS